MGHRIAAANSRREFIRFLVLGSVASVTSNPPWTATAVASVVPLATTDVAVLRLRIADFSPLGQGPFSAVRIGFTSVGQVGPTLPIIVSQDGADYFAVSAECTHQGCLISAFGSSKTSTCPCHGSRYAHDGTVLRGPAVQSLASYKVRADDAGFLYIELPDFPAYEVAIEQVLTPAATRVAVEFLALRNVDYEVVGRSSPDQPWQVLNFSRTETGATDQTAFRGTGVAAKLYVEREGASQWIAVGAKAKKV